MTTPLPPAARTPLWENVTEGARNGELRLQHCADCGQIQYPPREVCGHCLSDNLSWRITDGAGVILARTRLHISVDPWFQDHLPVAVALVKLDAGPVLYAFANDGNAGAPVVVDARIDASGQAVLHAATTKALKTNKEGEQ